MEPLDKARGVRAARNRVHHQWADAIRILVTVDDTAAGGVHVELLWRNLGELPEVPKKYRKPADDEAYRTNLQGRRVESALQDLLKVFELLKELLDPPRPRSQPR